MASIAVVIATRNRCAFLAEALASVRRQTRAPEQIIVVDDASSDGTAGLLASMPDIQVISGAGRGVAAARNLATPHVRADFVCVLDDDDIMLPHRIAAHRASFAEAGECAVSHGGWIDFEHQSLALSYNPGFEYPVLWLMLTEGGVLAHGAAAYRRDVLSALPYNEELIAGADMDLHFRIFASGVRARHCGSYVLLRRRHGAGLTDLHGGVQKEVKKALIARYGPQAPVTSEASRDAHRAEPTKPKLQTLVDAFTNRLGPARLAGPRCETLADILRWSNAADHLGPSWTWMTVGDPGIRAAAVLASQQAAAIADLPVVLESTQGMPSGFDLSIVQDFADAAVGKSEDLSMAYKLAEGTYRVAVRIGAHSKELHAFEALAANARLPVWYVVRVADAEQRRDLDATHSLAFVSNRFNLPPVADTAGALPSMLKRADPLLQSTSIRVGLVWSTTHDGGHMRWLS